MKRVIKNHPARLEAAHLVVTEPAAADIVEWLRGQCGGYTWLLAHTEQGVVWGKVVDGRLITSHDVAPNVLAELGAETLWQARLFGSAAELLVWRDGDGRWMARTIRDTEEGAATWQEAIDEAHILWGTTPELGEMQAGRDVFTLMSDGAQGLRHAPPVVVAAPTKGYFEDWERPLRLTVRQYVAEDVETGFTRIAASRLVAVA